MNPRLPEPTSRWTLSSGNASPFPPTRSARVMPRCAGPAAMSRLCSDVPRRPAALSGLPELRPLRSDSLFTEV